LKRKLVAEADKCNICGLR